MTFFYRKKSSLENFFRFWLHFSVYLANKSFKVLKLVNCLSYQELRIYLWTWLSIYVSVWLSVLLLSDMECFFCSLFPPPMNAREVEERMLCLLLKYRVTFVCFPSLIFAFTILCSSLISFHPKYDCKIKEFQINWSRNRENKTKMYSVTK